MLRPWSSVSAEIEMSGQCVRFLLEEGNAVSWFPTLFLLHPLVPSPPRTCQYGLLPWGVCFEQRQATRGRLGLPVHSALRLVPCQLGVQRTAWTKAHSLQKIGAAFRLPPTSRAAFVDGRLITLVESVKR